jgi:predicted kinase
MRVIIMAGVPGSGKSTWIKENHTGAIICSADDYFVGLGRNFDPSKLGEAHGACVRKFVLYVANHDDDEVRENVVIVDNTNTTVLEMAPYVAIAAAYGVSVEIVEMDCPVGLAAKRNIHNVPMRTCLRMGDNLMSLEIPPFWNVKRTEVKTY